MDTKQYLSLFRPWDMSFLQKFFFTVLVRNSPEISTKIIIIRCFLKPVIFLSFLSFLTLQLEPPKHEEEVEPHPL